MKYRDLVECSRTMGEECNIMYSEVEGMVE